MFDKIVAWLGGVQDALRELDAKAQEEAIKYSNKQVKKAAAAGMVIGVVVTLIVQVIL